MFKPLRPLALALAAFTALSAQAVTLVSLDAGAQDLAVDAAGQQLAVDLRFNHFGSAAFTIGLEADDLQQWLRLNAVISNHTGEALPGLQLSLTGAEFALAGSVSPQFGWLAAISGNSTVQTLVFAPYEPLGIDLGDPFGQAGAQDWLIAPTGLAAGDQLTLTISAVPEPSAWALWLGGLAMLGRLQRRRRSA